MVHNPICYVPSVCFSTVIFDQRKRLMSAVRIIVYPRMTDDNAFEFYRTPAAHVCSVELA